MDKPIPCSEPALSGRIFLLSLLCFIDRNCLFSNSPIMNKMEFFPLKCINFLVCLLVCNLIIFKTIFFFLFRATHAAYGSSQARGPIGATVASLRHGHSNAKDPSCVCDLHHSSRQGKILNPLSEASDRTPILMYTS